jgi:hypothetical protein
LIFAVYDLGFRARSALEIDDSSQNRRQKIQDIIEDSRYGIHDLSSVTLDANTGVACRNIPGPESASGPKRVSGYRSVPGTEQRLSPSCA